MTIRGPLQVLKHTTNAGLTIYELADRDGVPLDLSNVHVLSWLGYHVNQNAGEQCNGVANGSDWELGV